MLVCDVHTSKAPSNLVRFQPNIPELLVKFAKHIEMVRQLNSLTITSRDAHQQSYNSNLPCLCW